MRLTAYAKLNLNLHITGKRDDGYHLLQSLVAFTEFGDTLEFFPADSISLEIRGDFAGSLSGADNLVLRAARGLQHLSDCTKGARIVLTKQIPIGAGLGGGSSDAAAALLGLCDLWKVSLPAADMHALAVSLGSDVPACYAAVPSWIEGIGDKIMPFARSLDAWVLLVNPGKPLLTADVYKQFKGPFTLPRSLPTVLDATLHNDLESPAILLMPEIKMLLASLAQTDCTLARMSGSGATCFALYDTQPQAEAALQAMQKRHGGGWMVVTRLRNA